jgi:hypothetical protein
VLSVEQVDILALVRRRVAVITHDVSEQGHEPEAGFPSDGTGSSAKPEGFEPHRAYTARLWSPRPARI